MSAIVNQHGAHWDVYCEGHTHTAVNLPTEEEAQAWAAEHDAWHAAHPPVPAPEAINYTPTVVGVRAAYIAGADPVFTEAGQRTEYRTQAVMHQEFDRWLTEHDHAVRTQWEMRRKPEPIVIENIDGASAAAFLKRAKAEAWDEGFDAQGEQSFDSSGKPVGVITRNPYRSEA